MYDVLSHHDVPVHVVGRKMKNNGKIDSRNYWFCVWHLESWIFWVRWGRKRHEECTMITTQNEWLIHSLEVRIIIQKIEPVLASERLNFTILISSLCCVCRNTLRVQCRVRVGTYGIPTARIIHIPPLAYNSCVCLHNMILVFVRCIQFQ